jgi:hypothetical protein
MRDKGSLRSTKGMPATPLRHPTWLVPISIRYFLTAPRRAREREQWQVEAIHRERTGREPDGTGAGQRGL